MARISKADQQEAISNLQSMIKPGDTVYCILRHVSRSGMFRVIDLVVMQGGQVRSIGWEVARVLGDSWDDNRDGIRVSGCGMDMGFHLVYNLGRVLYRDNFVCTGKGCRANDHFNGDRDYSPHKHSDAGYALQYRWI